MPRRPRIHLDDVPLHIVQRGHNREACFFAEEDYHAYLHWLGANQKGQHRNSLLKNQNEEKTAGSGLAIKHFFVVL